MNALLIFDVSNKMSLPPVLTSPSAHICAVLWPGCSPYGSRDTENLSLCSFLCQALLFLLHPFRSLTSVRELSTLSSSGVLSPPPLPPSLPLSFHPFPYLSLGEKRVTLTLHQWCPFEAWGFKRLLNKKRKQISVLGNTNREEKKRDDSCQYWQLWFNRQQHEWCFLAQQTNCILQFSPSSSFPPLLFSPHTSSSFSQYTSLMVTPPTHSLSLLFPCFALLLSFLFSAFHNLFECHLSLYQDTCLHQYHSRNYYCVITTSSPQSEHQSR